MKCQNCQKELTLQDQICPNCGVPTVNQSPVVERQAPIQNEVAQEPVVSQQEAVVQPVVEESPQPIVEQPVVERPVVEESPQPVVEQPVVEKVQQEVVEEPPTEENIEPPVKLKKPPKNKSVVPVILLIIIIIGAIGALIYFFGDDYINLKGKSNSNYKIVFKGIELEIPSNFKYEVRDNYILVFDNTNTWEAKIEKFYAHNYIDYKNNSNYIKEKFSNLNYEVENYQNKEYGGLSLTSFETIIEEKNVLIGLLDESERDGVIISVTRNDNTYDYEVFNKLVPILSTVSYMDVILNNLDSMTINEILDRGIIEPDTPPIEEEPIIEDENIILPPENEEPNNLVQPPLEDMPVQ